MAKNIWLVLFPILCAIYRTGTSIEDVNICFFRKWLIGCRLLQCHVSHAMSCLKADSPCVCNSFTNTWLISIHIHHCLQPGDKGPFYSSTCSYVSREVWLMSQWISIPVSPALVCWSWLTLKLNDRSSDPTCPSVAFLLTLQETHTRTLAHSIDMMQAGKAAADKKTSHGVNMHATVI